MKASEKNNQDTKWVFLKKGTCSRTLFYILNREFDHPLEKEEQAADVLAGGIMQYGYQCGLLFGSVLAMGAEAHQRRKDTGEGIALAIHASQGILKAFVDTAGSDGCEEITEIDFKNKKDFAKYMISGKFLSCFKLADRWAPVAIKTAKEMLSKPSSELPPTAISCSSQVVQKMGANEQEALIVAGLAGGLALSGHACGALSAAIWMRSLQELKKSGKVSYTDPRFLHFIEEFLKETDYEFLCENICGKRFQSIEDHSQYMENGGCSSLLNRLSTIA